MGRRMRGRPRKRWIDDVEEDMRTMGVRGWRRIVNDRTEWKKNSSNRLRPTQGYNAIRRRRRRRSCDLRAVRVRFMINKVEKVKEFSPNTSFIPVNIHSINDASSFICSPRLDTALIRCLSFRRT
jgi:hypothetical protein